MFQLFLFFTWRVWAGKGVRLVKKKKKTFFCLNVFGKCCWAGERAGEGRSGMIH